MKKIDQALTNDHTIHRGDVIARDWYKGVASPIRMRAQQAEPAQHAAEFSQHTVEVLAEFGYSGGEIDALSRRVWVCGTERKR